MKGIRRPFLFCFVDGRLLASILYGFLIVMNSLVATSKNFRNAARLLEKEPSNPFQRDEGNDIPFFFCLNLVGFL